MKATFTVKGRQYEVSIDKRERAEDDKHNPFSGSVSGQDGGAVQGSFQVTDGAIAAAEELAQSGSASAESLLATACGKAVAAELVIRKLRPDFSFVVDHRWFA